MDVKAESAREHRRLLVYNLGAQDEQERLQPGWVRGPGRRRHLCAAAITEAGLRAHKDTKMGCEGDLVHVVIHVTRAETTHA